MAICPSVGWLKDFNDGQAVLDAIFNGDNIQPANNVNWPQLDNPEVNRAMDRASVLTDPAERARAWGAIDRLITELAPTVPWLWDKQPYAISSNVNGVIHEYNACFDFAWSSLK